VLAVVVNGLIGAQTFLKHQSSQRRVLGYTTWEIFIIVLNCFIFILIGSQLDEMVEEMTWGQVGMCCLYSFFIWVMMSIVRMMWVSMKASITAFNSTESEHSLLLRESTIIGWAGMRGVVSLTAALALPLTLPDGAAILGRSHVVFMTFMVIMFSLVLPALTLPSLIRWLKLRQTSNRDLIHEIRLWLVKIAQEEVSRLHKVQSISEEEARFLATYFETRSLVWELSSPRSSEPHKLESARKKVVTFQRTKLLQIWENGQLDDNLLKLFERELDIEETSLARAEL
jgi:CPA1 family monovalent cation:H+ antiporter